MTISIFNFNIEIYYLVVLLPLVCGLLGYIIKRLRTEFNFLGFLLTLFFVIKLFIFTRSDIVVQTAASILGINFTVYIDSLAGFIVLFNAIFAFLVWMYSLKSMAKHPRVRVYNLYIALTLAAANGVVITGNLIFMFIFWNVLVFTLYGLLLVGKTDSSAAARKAITIIGISDFIMLLGIAIIFIKIGHVDFPASPVVTFSDPWYVTAYIFILAGVLAKAGAVPMHTWIPEAAKVVPATTMAYIPASLDKLVGIYLLVRFSYFFYDISTSFPLRLLLMIIGAVTIIAAVAMAMVQKEAMRLLSFHAVSQVGYMVLGIGTGVPIGIAGGLFHMVNHTIYKTCLFFSAGSVEYRARTTDLDHLGGLGTRMPLTLFIFLIAAFAISGVPPLNGFFSKWMVYQGVIEFRHVSGLWPIFLIAAMFGSILTLASFLKLTHAMFLGERPRELNKVNEARFEMVVPALILAFLCIVFGVFASQIPLRYLIYPSLPSTMAITETGTWSPWLATILILVGIIIGLVVFFFGTATRPRKSRVFVGGEIMDEEAARITGPNFYSSIYSFDLLKKTYQFGEDGAFDIYNHIVAVSCGLGRLFKDVINRVFVAIFRFIGELVGALGRLTSKLHTGELYNYVGWIFLGGIVLMLLLFL